MSSRWEREQEREAAERARRRSELFRHVGWRSAYAPALGCSHACAVEIENDDPIEHPVPLPAFWIPIRLRHWVCAECCTAVNPHAFESHCLAPIPEAQQREWWDRWRAYEREINLSRTS